MDSDRYIAQKTNIIEVEKEINNRFQNAYHLKQEDLQLYLELNKDNLYPIDFSIGPDGYISLKDDANYILKNIYVGSNKQFFYKSYTILEDKTNKLKLDNTFKTAWDGTKYLIFRNGYLLNNSVYKIGIPSFDNFLATKTIYTTVTFKKNDRIDIFYIENDDLLHDVPFNRDLYINTRRIFATQDNQLIVKIPYPYDEYPRGEKMFICMTEDGRYLDNRYDYTTSENGEYITLYDKNILPVSYVDYLIFLFPYVRADFETEGYDEDKENAGNASGIDFEYSYSILSPDNEEEGIVHFYPIFEYYNIDKSNFILFGNSTFIDPERYKVIDNGTIQFLNETDKKHCSVAKYTMVIFKEQDILDAKNLVFGLEFHRVIAEEDKQQKFYIPKVDNQKKSFMAFVGSASIDVHNKFLWKPEIDQMILVDEADFIKKGRCIDFIFYTTDQIHLIRDKEISFKKMMWDLDTDGSTYIPSNLYNDISFNDSNLLLFLNGTFIQPDRYRIEDNKIIFLNEWDQPLLHTKSLTGIYLVSYKPNYSTEGDGPYKYIDMKEDHDWIWYDEMYAVPYI